MTADPGSPITEQDLLAAIDHLDADALHEWIALGLVLPEQCPTGYLFDATDVARVHLICDLSYDLGLTSNSLPVVVSLIDQLHRTRHALRSLSGAVAEAPAEVRESIVLRARTTMKIVSRPAKPDR